MMQVKQTLNLLATKIPDNLVLPEGPVFYGARSTSYFPNYTQYYGNN